MKRLESLDALRGFDMFFIMGGASLLMAIAQLFPESGGWQTVAEQMRHVPWEGLHLYDTVFPLFLFIAGVSFPFSLARQRENGRSMWLICLNIVRRGLLLVLLGMIYNGLLDFHFDTVRFCSVLGRIGLAWMCAALIYCAVRDIRAIVGIIAVILIGYWLFIAFVPSPGADGADPFSKEGCIACWLDVKMLGAHSFRPEYDPEGLVSTIPAIATALMGILSGVWIKQEGEGMTGGRKAAVLAVSGIIMAVAGFAWNFLFPINKALWSSSFVCAVGGYSLIMLAVFYYFIDVLGCHGWDRFFVVIGMNSITIYMVNRFVPMSTIAERLFGGCVGLFSETFQPVMSAIAFILVAWLFLYFLYRHKVFLKV